MCETLTLTLTLTLILTLTRTLTLTLTLVQVAAAQHGCEMIERMHEVQQLTSKLEEAETPELAAQDRAMTKDRRRTSPGGRSPRS